MVCELPSKSSSELALIKPLNKKPEAYGRKLQDGTVGGFPGHVKSMMLANEEYGLELIVGVKYGVVAVKTNELTGVRKKKMAIKVIAFDLIDGLPDRYEINYEAYLDSNLWGKISNLFDCKPKELKEKILTQDVKDKLGIKELNV